jgi:hypothetical protein
MSHDYLKHSNSAYERGYIQYMCLRKKTRKVVIVALLFEISPICVCLPFL